VFIGQNLQILVLFLKDTFHIRVVFPQKSEFFLISDIDLSHLHQILLTITEKTLKTLLAFSLYLQLQIQVLHLFHQVFVSLL